MSKFLDSLTEDKIFLFGYEEKFDKLNLGDFFRLEKHRKNLLESLKTNNKELFKDTINCILKLQTKKDFLPKRFTDILKNLIIILAENRISSEVEFLKPNPKKTEEIKNSWDFDNRWMTQWIDTFARTYHWELEKILSIPVNLAVYLMQELQVNSQLDREWDYSLTEMAYAYDQNTKKSKFVPLSRPHWMISGTSGIKKTKIRKDMLPYGVIQDLSGMGVFANEFNQQDISAMDTETTT
jgi:hypothetical protein